MNKYSNTFIRLTIFSLLLSLIGCAHSQGGSSIPAPESFEQNSQKHIQAVEHWKVIAQDTADQISASIEEKKMKDAVFYVNPVSEITPFNRAFYDFLMESLIKNQIKITPDKYRGVPINYKIQAIQFEAERNPYFENKLPWTSLTAGVLVARGIVDSVATFIQSVPMAIATAEDLRELNKGLQLELVVTTSILNNNVYTFRNSDIYYANAIDVELYRKHNQAPHAKIFKDPFYQY